MTPGRAEAAEQSKSRVTPAAEPSHLARHPILHRLLEKLFGRKFPCPYCEQ